MSPVHAEFEIVAAEHVSPYETERSEQDVLSARQRQSCRDLFSRRHSIDCPRFYFQESATSFPRAAFRRRCPARKLEHITSTAWFSSYRGFILRIVGEFVFGFFMTCANRVYPTCFGQRPRQLLRFENGQNNRVQARRKWCDLRLPGRYRSRQPGASNSGRTT